MDVCTIEKNINVVNLINNIPDGFCIYSAKLQHIEFTIWNKYMIEITGYTMKEINKIGWNNILCNTHLVSEFIGNIDIYKDKEYKIISKNGVRKIISMSISIINTEDGETNILALVKDITKYKQVEQEFREVEERYDKIQEFSLEEFIFSSRDIFERVKVEKALKENEERYKCLIELLPFNIYIFSKNKILFSNKIGLDYLGVSSLETIKGKSYLEIMQPYPSHVEHHKKSIEQVIANQYIPLTQEKFIRIADNKILDFEAFVTRYPYEHEENTYLLVARDISDRKKAEKLEEDMKQKSILLHEAAEYERLRTEFFANISHELRTPINVILSSLQLLNLKTNNANEISWCQKEYKKYPAIMKQNCYRLVRLINNLIDVTKIDSGYFNLNLINTNIVNVVEDITLSVVDYTGNKGISLIFDTEVEEKVLACDPDKIERIILNLISNAVKFTEPGGSIFVSIIDKGQDLIISVKDTGIGISKDKQKMIFERFVQVDKSLARNSEGSGIGLSLVKSLVEMHKGTITVKSELNKGSEFIITLPSYLVEEKNNTVYSNNHFIQENLEKINIEFSDIYY